MTTWPSQNPTAWAKATSGCMRTPGIGPVSDITDAELIEAARLVGPDNCNLPRLDLLINDLADRLEAARQHDPHSTTEGLDTVDERYDARYRQGFQDGVDATEAEIGRLDALTTTLATKATQWDAAQPLIAAMEEVVEALRLWRAAWLDDTVDPDPLIDRVADALAALDTPTEPQP